MYKIATLNKISPAGLSRFAGHYTFTDKLESAEGILVRSQNMFDLNLSNNLLAIARAGAGTNNIPVDECSERGIVVFNTPGANANAVTELVIASMFMAARNLPDALGWVNSLSGDVTAEVEKGKGRFAGNEIKGKTIGVIGLGAVGVLVANDAEKLGMRVIGYDPYITVKAAHSLSNNISIVADLGKLLPECDYISIHVPAIDATEKMIDANRFGQMKKGAFLLNFSRGSLVDKKSLFDAMKSGAVSKYITDFPDDELLGKKDIICTPHLGASTEEAEDWCAIMAADQMIDYLENGNISNSVNYPECSMGPFSGAALCRVCIFNKNIPSMLSKITSAFSGVNIRNMLNNSMGQYAYTMIDFDSEVDNENLLECLRIGGVIGARKIG